MRVRCAVLLGLALGLAPSLQAHPHVWVQVRAELTVSGGFVDGVWSVWTFDDQFSQLILSDGDPSGSGQIDAAATARIKKGYFDNLKGYGYFSHLQWGTKALAIPEPTRFQASVDARGLVSYRFFLPLNLRLAAQTPFSVSFYDDSFFTDMVFIANDPVKLTVTNGGRAQVSLKPDKSKTFYGGQVTPVYAVILWSPS